MSLLFHWHADPVAFAFGPLVVRWYGLLFVGAFFIGQRLLARQAAREGLDPSPMEGLLLHALLGTVLGARLVHVLFYDPMAYAARPWAVLAIWEGGLASHGGAIGLIAGLWVGARRARPPLDGRWLIDRAAVPAALGAVLVRVANFINAEILGRPTGGAWGVVFERVDSVPRHPVQLYEALAYALVFALLWRRTLRASPQDRPGGLLGVFLVGVFTARIGAEFFKTPQAAYEQGLVFTVGQALSLPFVVLGLWLLWRVRRGPSRGAAVA